MQVLCIVPFIWFFHVTFLNKNKKRIDFDLYFGSVSHFLLLFFVLCPISINTFKESIEYVNCAKKT